MDYSYRVVNLSVNSPKRLILINRITAALDLDFSDLSFLDLVFSGLGLSRFSLSGRGLHGDPEVGRHDVERTFQGMARGYCCLQQPNIIAVVVVVVVDGVVALLIY